MTQDTPQDSTLSPEETAPVETKQDETLSTDGATTLDPRDEEIARLREALARSQADYSNLVKRNDRDREETRIFLTSKILLPLLPSLDHLTRAVEIKAGVEGDSFVDGVRSVLTGLEKYLEWQRVTKIISIGQEVNPEKHDVMTQSAGPEGQIISEFETGYMIDGRVLRHAKVVVGSGE